MSSARNSALVGEDEWTFSSSLPDQTPHEITLVDSAVNILFLVSKAREADGAIKIKASISNNTTTPVADFTLQIAVMKVFTASPQSITLKRTNEFNTETKQGYSLRLEPQTGRNLGPNQRAGITQVIHVVGVEQGRGTALKIRWKASYAVGDAPKQEQGELASLGVA